MSVVVVVVAAVAAFAVVVTIVPSSPNGRHAMPFHACDVPVCFRRRQRTQRVVA